MKLTSETIRAFAKSKKIDCKQWTVAQTDTMLAIRDIPSQADADTLATFLSTQGMAAEIVMGDRREKTWLVLARQTRQPTRSGRVNGRSIHRSGQSGS